MTFTLYTFDSDDAYVPVMTSDDLQECRENVGAGNFVIMHDATGRREIWAENRMFGTPLDGFDGKPFKPAD